MSGMMTILKNVRRYERMKRKELEKLPVLRATTAMLKQAENEPMISSRTAIRSWSSTARQTTAAS